MPNFLFLLLSFAYHLALAIWIGGAIALGALTAPELFRQMPRQQAGGIVGPILRRFARLRLAALVVAIIAAATRHMLWETHTASPWIAIRWAALFLLAARVAYEIAALEPAMQRHRSLIRPEGGEADPNRLVFMVLHRRSEAMMKLSLLVALLALFLS